MEVDREIYGIIPESELQAEAEAADTAAAGELCLRTSPEYNKSHSVTFSHTQSFRVSLSQLDCELDFSYGSGKFGQCGPPLPILRYVKLFAL